VTGRAAAVQLALVARGFRSGGSADAGHSYPKTQVRYAPGQASKGLTAALYLGTANVVEAASTSVQDGSRILHGDVLVVIGSDYLSLRGLLAQSASAATSSTVTSARSRPATGTSTTTTTPATTPDTRYVPVSPKSLEPLVGCP
jgi:hypothetical protein